MQERKNQRHGQATIFIMDHLVTTVLISVTTLKIHSSVYTLVFVSLFLTYTLYCQLQQQISDFWDIILSLGKVSEY